MPIPLNEAELQTIQAHEEQARRGEIGYWHIYAWLVDNLVGKGVSGKAFLWGLR